MAVDAESFLDQVNRLPFDFYRRQRERGSVHWDAGMNAWMVYGYDECRTVMTDEATYAHPYHQFKGAAEVQGGPRGILMLRGDEHRAVHRFMLQHFSPKVVTGYREGFIGPLVKRWIDRIESRSEIDLAAYVFEQLPSDVIAAMLGLGWDDEELLEQCKVWNDAIMAWSETFGEDPDILEQALQAAQNLEDVLLPVIRDRRDDPQDDFISVLWREGPGLLDPWGEREILAQCRVLFFAGSETTAHFLANVAHVLVEEPDWQQRLRDHPDEIPSFVEEILRFYGVIHFRVRVAAEDTILGGQRIAAGDRIHPVNMSANRDPAHFDAPDEIRPGRDNIRSHVAFNIGPRFCIGANLARAEAVEVIEQLLDRFASITWDGSSPQPQFRGHMPRSFRPLHVSLQAS